MDGPLGEAASEISQIIVFFSSCNSVKYTPSCSTTSMCPCLTCT